jgi:hypothetical protein
MDSHLRLTRRIRVAPADMMIAPALLLPPSHGPVHRFHALLVNPFYPKDPRASLRLDRFYLQRQSLPLDLQLIALSFAANLIGKRPVRRVFRMIRTSGLRARQPRDIFREPRHHERAHGESRAES